MLMLMLFVVGGRDERWKHSQGRWVFEFSFDVVGKMFPIISAHKMEISYLLMLKYTPLPAYPRMSIYVCHLVDIL